jgi:hypothetical protein
LEIEKGKDLIVQFYVILHTNLKVCDVQDFEGLRHANAILILIKERTKPK